jgi:hypothetical protein
LAASRSEHTVVNGLSGDFSEYELSIKNEAQPAACPAAISRHLSPIIKLFDKSKFNSLADRKIKPGEGLRHSQKSRSL